MKEPQFVGTFIPSSRFLARKMVRAIRWEPGVRIVELGPGTGAITSVIMERLPPSGYYLGIEKDPAFVEILCKRFPHADVIHESAVKLGALLLEHSVAAVDHVISALPFTSLPEWLTRQILAEIQASLRPGGTFTTMQYFALHFLPKAREFKAQMQALLGPPQSIVFEWRNVLPALVLTWKKL